MAVPTLVPGPVELVGPVVGMAHYLVLGLGFGHVDPYPVDFQRLSLDC